MTDQNSRPGTVIIDDHPIVREGLALLINQSAEFRVCGQAGHPAEAVQVIERTRPALAIVDLSLGEGSGLRLIEELSSRFPDVMVLVVSMHDEILYAERTLRAGAKGYVMKSTASEKVIEALKCVLDGGIYISETIKNHLARKVAGAPSGKQGSSLESLSNRELEVMQLTGRGYGTSQIARSLHISIKTVETHYARIKRKLDLQTTRELVMHASQYVNPSGM